MGIAEGYGVGIPERYGVRLAERDRGLEVSEGAFLCKSIFQAHSALIFDSLLWRNRPSLVIHGWLRKKSHCVRGEPPNIW